jgi:hypothetical protein
MVGNGEGSAMIATVIRTSAGRVMAFDGAGRQLPEFQGNYRVVKRRLLRHAAPATVFQHWYGRAAVPAVVRVEEW